MGSNKEYTAFATHILKIKSSINKWKTLWIYYAEKLYIKLLREISAITYMKNNVY
jgi:hypothetical protein